MVTQHLVPLIKARSETGKTGNTGKSGQDPRTVSAQVLSKVFAEQHSLSTLLPVYLGAISDPRKQAFAQALCYGVLRHYFSLNLILENLLDKKLKKKDADIKALILIGLYQLAYMRTPAHAAVSATVDCCKALKKIWAKNLINALLRRYQREQDTFVDLVAKNELAKYEHPKWLLDLLKNQYPEHWLAIIEANNIQPPMNLRVNARHNDRDTYLKQLETSGIEAHASSFNNHGITLTHPIGVESLPGFSEGHVSVQDLAAQLAVPLLDAQADERILDACSAPGGKLAHLLEISTSLRDVIAIELETHRLKKLQDTLKRLQLDAQLIHADARAPDSWWDKQAFDRIMIDAPCSASGVIRRHPDIKYLRTNEAVQNITRLQTEILDALWPLLKNGGKLLYITCSVIKAENDDQIAAFIEKHNDAKPIPILANWGQETRYGRQILPGEHAMDGFYYAQLHKT